MNHFFSLSNKGLTVVDPRLLVRNHGSFTSKGDFIIDRPGTAMDIMAEDALALLEGKIAVLDPAVVDGMILKDLEIILNESSEGVPNHGLRKIEDLLDDADKSPDKLAALRALKLNRVRDLTQYSHLQNARLLKEIGPEAMDEQLLRELVDDAAVNSTPKSNILSLPVDKLSGVGDAIARHLNTLEIRTIQELADYKYYQKAAQLVDSAKSGRRVALGGATLPTENKLKNKLIAEAHSATIGKVSIKLNTSNLDPTLKFIFSYEPLYVYALYRGIVGENVKDVDGVFNRIMQGAQKIKAYINKQLLAKVIDKHSIDIAEGRLVELRTQVALLDFPYTQGQVEQAILDTIQNQDAIGILPDLVEAFLNKGELRSVSSRDKGRIKNIMVRYLNQLGLSPTAFDKSTQITDPYDEYLAIAYNFAVQNQGATGDPVKNVFNNTLHTFDHQVDYFESIEAQSIDAENILAAGTLYYIKVLADDLGIFRITDSILMDWTGGRLDFQQFDESTSSTPTKLYNYYKLREHRTSPEERMMFYRMILNVGEGEVMENLAVNVHFTPLWDTLMREVIRYIQKYERSEEPELVSRSGVNQAIIALQHNLTRHTSGIVKALLPEMYAHLESAIEILNAPEIVSQYGQGHHRNLWNVIERVSLEQFNYIPNISALRTSAVKGHQIFRDIAGFEEGTFSRQAFQDFVNRVESFIIAQSQLDNEPFPASDNGNNSDLNGAERELETMEEDWNF